MHTLFIIYFDGEMFPSFAFLKKDMIDKYLYATYTYLCTKYFVHAYKRKTPVGLPANSEKRIDQ